MRAPILLRLRVRLEASGHPVPEVSAPFATITPRGAIVVLAIGHDNHADDRGGTAAAVARFHGTVVGLGLALPFDVERGSSGCRCHEHLKRLGGRGNFGRGAVPFKHGKLSRPELAFRPVPPDTHHARLGGRGGGVVPMREWYAIPDGMQEGSADSGPNSADSSYWTPGRDPNILKFYREFS